MKTHRSIALTAVLAGLALSSPLLERAAAACGTGAAEISPAMLIQWAALAEMGRNAADFEVDGVQLTSEARAVVDLRRVVGARSGQRTRMIAVRGDDGQWSIAASWAVNNRASRNTAVRNVAAAAGVRETSVSDAAVIDTVVSRGACCSFQRGAPASRLGSQAAAAH